MSNFLDRHGLKQTKWYHRLVCLSTEHPRLCEETSITTAYFGTTTRTHVLRDVFAHDSAIVYFETESLHEGAASLLSSLEALNPRPVSWMASQFAVQFTQARQDEALEDILMNDVLDDAHEKELHFEQLPKMRRRHCVQTSRRWRI
jgi:hypothetical protein